MVTIYFVVSCRCFDRECSHFEQAFTLPSIHNATGFPITDKQRKDRESFARKLSVTSGHLEGGHWPTGYSKGRCKRCLKRKREHGAVWPVNFATNGLLGVLQEPHHRESCLMNGGKFEISRFERF